MLTVEYKGKKFILGKRIERRDDCPAYAFATICLECGHRGESLATATSMRSNQINDQKIVWDWCREHQGKGRLIHFWLYDEK